MFKKVFILNKKSSMFSQRHEGFTLSEILMVLVVIGILASLTIPPMVNEYQQNETVTKLRKFVSTIYGVIQSSETENGPRETWDDFYTGNSTTDIDNFVDKYIVNHLSFSKRCKVMQKSECLYNGNYKIYTQPDKSTPVATNGVTCFAGGNGALPWAAACNYFLMNDGSLIAMEVRGFGGAIDYPCSALSGGAIQLAVDINGPLKGPNSLGHDVFDYLLICRRNCKQTLWITPYSCTSTDGKQCANKIIRDNWQIKSNYPW